MALIVRILTLDDRIHGPNHHHQPNGDGQRYWGPSAVANDSNVNKGHDLQWSTSRLSGLETPKGGEQPSKDNTFYSQRV